MVPAGAIASPTLTREYGTWTKGGPPACDDIHHYGGAHRTTSSVGGSRSAPTTWRAAQHAVLSMGRCPLPSCWHVRELRVVQCAADDSTGWIGSRSVESRLAELRQHIETWPRVLPPAERITRGWSLGERPPLKQPFAGG